MDHYSKLTPDIFLNTLEKSLDKKLTGLARSLPSYINRVYEIQADDGSFFVAKFYRPGRWSMEALQDEHLFLADCEEVEIPVVCPCKLSNGKTLDNLNEIMFTVFPKKAGRQFDIESDENWVRIGTLLGRLHNVGKKRSAPSRLTLTPEKTTRIYIDQLVSDSITDKWKEAYGDICSRIIDFITPHFEGQETIRIHGDFHVGNILHRPGQGLMIIDFDDMMNGPPVQDFWLLMPELYPACQKHLEKLIKGYGQFRDINPRSPLLIEGLRAMRMIYFTAWCSMQRSDFQFQTKFPDWGTDSFWAREVRDLRVQYANMMDAFSF